jgi:hypothetical protein
MDEKPSASRERSKRNIALALVLGAVAVLFFLMSVVKFGK